MSELRISRVRVAVVSVFALLVTGLATPAQAQTVTTFILDQLPFGAQALGTTSPPGSVPIAPTSGSVTIAAGTSIVGTNASDFAIVSDTCSGKTIGPDQPDGSSCSVDVTFSPSSTGHRVAALVLTDGEGNQHPVVLTGLGVVVHGAPLAWGRNGDNQVGDGTSTDRSSPTPVSDLSDVVEIEGGFFHSLAVVNGGRVYAWGRNGEGQLGLGPDGPSSAATPQLLSRPTGVSAVSAGGFQSLALDSAGDVWQWGVMGSTFSSSTPEHITVPVFCETDCVNVVAVAAGVNHALALGDNGRVYAWGSNQYGQIGDGTNIDRPGATLVPNLRDIVAISAGEFYSVALRSDGTVWSWGNNAQGQLADCGTTDSNVPVQAKEDCSVNVNLTSVVRIDAGSNHTLALIKNGSVEYAGGPGVGADQQAFAPVPGLAGTVAAVSGGAQASFFEMANGTVDAWGDNRCGQLGLGNDHTCDSADVVATPTAVSALGKVEAVSAGHFTNYAIVNRPLDLALSVTPTTTPAGFSKIDERDINLAGASLDPGTLEGSAGPGDAPLGKNPLGKNPLGKNPLGKNPLGKNLLGENPLGKNPLGKNGLNQTAPPLRDVPVSALVNHHLPDPPLLSSLPVSITGGWQAILNTTAPDQSLTLNDAIDNAAWSSLKITDIDWSRTRFADFSPAAWLLGEIHPADVTLPSGSWASLLSSMGPGCGAFDPTTATFVDLQWARCDLTVVPWDRIGLSDIAGLSGSPLGGYKLDGILLSYTPLGDVPAVDVPPGLIDCTKLPSQTCVGHTLAEAQDADAIDHGADLSALSDQFSEFGVTITNMLPGMMDVTEYPYETMTLTQLIRSASLTGQPTVDYQATMNVTCPSAVGTPITLALPSDRFRPVPGGATFTVGGGSPIPAGAPTEAGANFTWTLPEAPCANLQGLTPVALDVSVVPGPTTGIFTSSLSAGGSDLQDQAPLTVTDGTETGNTVASATPILPNFIYTGRIDSASDLDYYTIDESTLSPGSVVAVYLSHLPTDEDLVMYGPASPALRSASLDLHPLGKNPLDDSGSCLPQDYVVQPQTLEDVPVVPNLAVRSFSTNRSQQQEVVCTVVRAGDSGDLTIQVSGFNGAQSNQPYVLRAVVVDPGPAPACTLPALTGGGSVNPMPGSIPSDTQTLILVNSKRFGDVYGSTAESNVMSSLSNLATATDSVTGTPIAKGAVIPVENNAGVQAAYNALDLAPCSPSAANGVVQAINAFVDQLRASYGLTQLKFIVLVGSDNVIPLARVPDLTTLGNQVEYAGNVRLNASGTENPVSAAFAQGYILSDDPYGSFAPIPWNGNALYMPDVSVGRLVETPSEIQDEITQFTSSNGRLDPSTALVTGYDFTKDSAAAIDGRLSTLATSTDSLISDTWGSTDLVPKLGSDRILAINGHFDHFRTQTANGDIVSTAQFLGQNPPLGSFMFTLGCNAGVPIPDIWFTSAPAGTTLDWGQSLAQRRGELLGNNGFGYGDDTTAAYSEQLMELVAQNLGPTMSVGQAVALAKGTYYGSLSAVGAYDIKALEESTFYGLPMYRIGAGGVVAASSSPSVGPAALSATALPTSIDPDTGLTVANVPLHPFVDPVADRHTAPHGRGEYFTGPEVQVSQFRPIEPVSSAFDMTQQGTKLHDAIVTGLQVQDFTHFDPVIAVPTLDQSGNEPEPLVTNVVFPTDFVATSSARTILGRKDFMVVDGGRFTSDPGTSGLGTQRIHLSEDVRAYYSTSNDFTRPRYRSVEAVAPDANSTAFAVDMQPNPSNDDQVVAVYVMYLAPGSDTFVLKRLAQSSTTPTHWTGTVNSAVSEYFVQAVDQNGNVGLSTFKGGAGPVIHSTPPPAGVAITVNGQPPRPGWYPGPVSVAITSASGEIFEVSVDGGQLQPVTGPFTVSGHGAHTVEYVGTQGTIGTLIVPIDALPPTFGDCPSVTQPILLNSGSRTVTIQASDADSGLDPANSVLTGTFQTNTPGDVAVTFRATDVVGNTNTKTCHYQVKYNFSGFFQPIDNNLTNIAKAGQTIPVKWRITDANGVGISDSSSFLSLTSSNTTIGTCTSAAEDQIETYSTTSGLKYLDNGNWLFNWKTPSSYQGSCRVMTVTLKDGTTHSATFQFK